MSDALTLAREYIARGWAPVPIPFREKAPAAKEWQKLRITDKEAANYFNGEPQNIGVLLGTPSNNLVDIDLDTPEARAVAPFFLPATHAIFGRKSSRTAHYLYVADKAPGTKAFNDPTVDKEHEQKARIVELRGTGGQTVFPGSTHKNTGEVIEWEQAGDPAHVGYGGLLQACQRVATFALIATHWDTGTRDDLCTATTGILLRAGFTDHEIERALHAIAAAADDEKIDSRTEKVARLRRELETGGRVYGFPKLAELTDPKVANAVRRWLGVAEEAPEVLAGPIAALATAEELNAAPYEVPIIVQQYMLEDAGAIVGPGGEGKTTLALYESVMIRLGGKLYGRDVLRPGPTLVITAEDRRAVVFSRLNKICTALNLTPEQREHVRAGVFVEDISGTFSKIAVADKDGAVKPAALVTEILDKYAGVGLSQLMLDPTSLIGAGERFGNDGAAELLRIARYLSERLKCAVRLVHHVSQAVYRERIRDQYAARGGTAFVDGSRFQHQLLTCDDRREFDCGKDFGGVWAAPAEVTDEDINNGRILVVLVHKLSYYARDRVPIFLVRRGFGFTHLPGAVCVGTGRSAEQDEANNIADAQSLNAFLVRKARLGIRLTTTEVARGYREELQMSRDGVLRAVIEAKRLNLITEVAFPGGERQGARLRYLQPTELAEM